MVTTAAVSTHPTGMHSCHSVMSFSNVGADLVFFLTPSIFKEKNQRGTFYLFLNLFLFEIIILCETVSADLQCILFVTS